MQSKQDQMIEKMLSEMQKKQWAADRQLQEKREVIASLADVERARARGMEDYKRDQIAQLEIERLNL